MAAVGVHCLLELYGCPVELLDDVEHVTRTLREAADAAGATWLGQVHHRFEPQGVTALGLLAESHMSMHTWPEIGYAAADCFTCGDTAMPDVACRAIARRMRARRSTLMRIPRATQLLDADLRGIDQRAAHMDTRQANYTLTEFSPVGEH